MLLIGEATHGTHEFYRDRARITQRLIAEKGFKGVVVEGDWPDAERVDRYVRGGRGDTSPEQALSSFSRRFPRWMWANTDVRDFVRWLRAHNEALPAEAARASFYGMDVYSLGPSANAVVTALETIDPAAARHARQRYTGFKPYHAEPERYGLVALAGSRTSLEKETREQFEDIQQLYRQQSAADTARADTLFSAIQNARIVRNAEEYYRAMYSGGVSSWNLRDKHMVDTVDAFAEHLTRRNGGAPAKIVIWAHNSHVGDARWTQTGSPQEWNIGQLMREGHSGQTALIGFTTYRGSVFAASAWDEPGKQRTVLPALPGSFSAVFHDTGLKDFLLLLRNNRSLADALPEPRLERDIGVLYLPETERESHYFLAHLTKQFDAVIHRDVTRAITPLMPP